MRAADEIERLNAVDAYHRATIGKCNTHIQEQEAEIEKLCARVAELDGELGLAVDLAESQRKRIAGLVDALKPFVDYALVCLPFNEDTEDDEGVLSWWSKDGSAHVSYGDLRRAAKAGGGDE